MHYLILPGYRGSGPHHWQSHWQERLASQPHTTVSRLEVEDWDQPTPQHWLAQFEMALSAVSGPVIVIAHSLGCILLNHALRQISLRNREKLQGALLVAPSDVERDNAPRPLKAFAPIRPEPLPFPTLVISADNDYAATPERCQWLVRQWQAEHVLIPSAGHINTHAGYRKWNTGLGYLAALNERVRQSQSIPCAC
ncbi:RBBP9/YdeN family alpha/beta hydrolase [Pokkaliibacter sp. CJK22405]|uniref:RBBP9/YdeN family alpha/beta hydrolase n=1 Tax=Pokkaliibacter sp. CJK22405 TaxID=3384615 RepID=UPI003984C7D9